MSDLNVAENGNIGGDDASNESDVRDEAGVLRDEGYGLGNTGSGNEVLANSGSDEGNGAVVDNGMDLNIVEHVDAIREDDGRGEGAIRDQIRLARDLVHDDASGSGSTNASSIVGIVSSSASSSSTSMTRKSGRTTQGKRYIGDTKLCECGCEQYYSAVYSKQCWGGRRAVDCTGCRKWIDTSHCCPRTEICGGCLKFDEDKRKMLL